MGFYAIFIPDKKLGISIKSFYNDKEAALSVLKQHKEARMKAFSSSEEAVSFYLNGPTEQFVKATPPFVSSPRSKEMKSLFIAPTSQKLVAFRKLIESNNISEVQATICKNPRYLMSSGDTPTILKEGPRYNALHIAAIEGRGEICRLILQKIEDTAYIEKLHGQRTSSTDEVSAILLDLYLNMPDKCRSETPLHFAAKHGSIDVVRELIAYPQCRVAPNADGLLPRDIICTRAKTHNATAEVRDAIRALLVDRYFVPLLRYEDNLVPPSVGEPFLHFPPARVDDPRSPPISPRREIKAYAGPMAQNKAHRFYRRWKTPPRLVVVSPQPLQTRSEELRAHHSSTPIKLGRRPRQLFANLSLDIAPPEHDRCEEPGYRHSDAYGPEDGDETVTSDSRESFMELKEEKSQSDDNGNHPAPVVESTPKRMFQGYRSIASDMDTSMDYNVSCVEHSFSFLCDETRMLYDRSRLVESPSYKERSLRLCNIEKGLETLGRTLATDESVGWKEYWNFLGKFCDLASKDGLRLFEDFLLERQTTTVPVQPAGKELSNTPVAKTSYKPSAAVTGWADANDSIDMLCNEMKRWNIAVSPETSMVGTERVDENRHGTPRETVLQTQLSNPYMCVTLAMKVFACRFVTYLGNISNIALNNFEQPPFLDIVQKLDTLVEDFRVDAAFHEIDFSKAHKLFAYLIAAHVHNQAKIERVAWIEKPRVQPAVLAAPETRNEFSSVQCIEHSLLTFMQIGTMLELANVIESDCRHLWESENLITACNCRPKVGTSVAKRTTERMRRRKQRAKRLTVGSPYLETPNSKSHIVDYVTYRDTAGTATLATNASLSDSNESSEDEDLYLSCSETIEEEQPDKGRDEDEEDFFTPPSSPTRRGSLAVQPYDTNNNAASEQTAVPEKPTAALVDAMETDGECRHVFIEGAKVSKQDLDVWVVLKSVQLDENEFPRVVAWKNAMQEHVEKKTCVPGTN